MPANEFMNIEGKKFSKSRNWAIWVPDILERYDPDPIRYYIAMTFPETRDSDLELGRLRHRATIPNCWRRGAIWSTGC